MRSDPDDRDDASADDPMLDYDGPTPAIYQEKLPADLMDRDAVKVIRRLTNYGYTAYLVGGGVRDLLLGRRAKDFDVATSAKPPEVRRLFRNCRVIGRRFRLAHIMFGGGKIIEVATFRRDPLQEFDVVPYTKLPDGALRRSDPPTRLVPIRADAVEDEDLLIKNDNVFGSPHEDAIRRDFTFNGLFYDVNTEQVIDFVGGMRDLRTKTVRTIGDPDVRFREDPVRILRAIKFSARIDMGIDPDLYDAMVEFRGELARAARPRIFEEILRFVRSGAAHRSFYLMWDSGVLAELLPEVASFLDDDAPESALTWARLRAIDARVQQGHRVPDDSVALAALLMGPIEEAIDGVRNVSGAYEEFMEDLAFRLAMPRRIKDRIRLLISTQRRLRTGKVGALTRREFFVDAATLYAIDLEARGEEVPEWAADPEDSGADAPPRRRRRRRSRRRD